MLISNGPSRRHREIPGGNCMGHIEIHRSFYMYAPPHKQCQTIPQNKGRPRAQSPMRHC